MKKYISAALSMFLIFILSFQVFAVNPVKATDEWLKDWDSRTVSDGKIWLTPGKNEKAVNFTWLSKTTKNSFSYKKQADAAWINAKISVFPSVYGFINTVSLSELSAAEYVYKYSADNVDYDETVFKISGKQSGFIILYTADPQLGRSDNDSVEAVQNDAYGWERTLYAADKHGAELILCGGDQVNDGFSAMQFNAFLSPRPLSSIPMATATGNHEFMSAMQSLYFKSSGVPQIENDYYFSYGNAVFIVLDSNNIVASVHEAVINNALKACPNAIWRIVMMHHSPYGAGREGFSNKAATARLTPLFDKYDIDLVLSGHDHYYSRTYPVYDNSVSDAGSVYFVANAGSGGKCSHISSPDHELTAFSTDLNVASYSMLYFTDEAIEVKSYITDTDEVFDSFTVVPTEKSERLPMFGIFEKIRAFIEFLISYIPVKLKLLFV